MRLMAAHKETLKNWLVNASLFCTCDVQTETTDPEVLPPYYIRITQHIHFYICIYKYIARALQWSMGTKKKKIPEFTCSIVMAKHISLCRLVPSHQWWDAKKHLEHISFLFPSFVFLRFRFLFYLCTVSVCCQAINLTELLLQTHITIRAYFWMRWDDH